MTSAPAYDRAVGATVLVIDDHELVRTSLVVALRAQGARAQPCRAQTIPEILEVAAGFPAGLVILDLDLGLDQHGTRIEGADAVGGLRSMGWRVLVVSGSDLRRRARIAAAIAAGAIGQVPKSAPFATLVEALMRAEAGDLVMTADERRRWVELHRSFVAEGRQRAELLSRLTIREQAVLERLAEGHRAAEIATEFVVSLSTVRSQIRAILAKLQVSSQLSAVAMLRGHDAG